MLVARELACRRGDALLFAGLDFSLAPGRSLWLKGANGSGKTSLLRILAGLAVPAAGQLLWDGRAAATRSLEYRARIVYLGHTAALKEELSATENLAELIALDAVPCKPAEIADAIAAVGLGARQSLAARHLSAGQRKRLLMARLMLCQRQLWLLDEAAVGLDQTALALFEALLARHLEAGGLAVFTSHQALEIAAPVDVLTLS